jgi:hypothetical protein
MKTLDRVFGCLMFLGGVGHGLGSYQFYKSQPMNLLWALSASFATFLLAALNLLRTGRPGDRSLAWTSFVGCLVQVGFAVCFGLLIRNMLDFRPLVTAIIALVLAAFSLRSAVQQRME